jgi:hypothetical protein
MKLLLLMLFCCGAANAQDMRRGINACPTSIDLLVQRRVGKTVFHLHPALTIQLY